MRQERQGEAFILVEAVLWGLFPVTSILALQALPPLVALAWSVAFAVAFFALLLTIRGRWRELADRAALKDILWVTLFIGVLYYVFYFFGLKHTSAGNAGILALTETFFSYLFFHVWRKDHIPGRHIAGALLMLLGACIVLSPNLTTFRPGDLLIVASAFVAPFGNHFQRRARKRVGSETVLFVRSLLSAPALFLLAFALGDRRFGFDLHRTLWFLVINGVALLGFSKIMWVEGIHRITVTKASALDTIGPVATLLYAWLLLGDVPTRLQLLAIAPMAAGVILLGANPRTAHRIHSHP